MRKTWSMLHSSLGYLYVYIYNIRYTAREWRRREVNGDDRDVDDASLAITRRQWKTPKVAKKLRGRQRKRGRSAGARVRILYRYAYTYDCVTDVIILRNNDEETRALLIYSTCNMGLNNVSVCKYQVFALLTNDTQSIIRFNQIKKMI